MDVLELSFAGERLGILPKLGGALAWWRHEGFDLLRPWDGAACVRRSACYPLVPYSNRIDKGRFKVGDRDYQVPPNFPGSPHSIHGVGWQREWKVETRTSRDCCLRLVHDPGATGGEAWPFAFTVEQRISLNEFGLSLSLRLANNDRMAMPAGLGWHPYFPRYGGAELAFEAGLVWLNDEHQMPAEHMLVPSQWAFTQRRPLGYVGLDNCFEGWHRHAELYWPKVAKGIEINAGQGLDYLVVFTPPAPLAFVAVEPVSHLNNALNSVSPQRHGVVWLAPGEIMERQMTLRRVGSREQ